MIDTTTSKNDIQIVRLSDVKVEPWKNGFGITQTLAQGLGWRLSLARVALDGPFSVFYGWQRHSTVVAGEGLRLDSGPDSVFLEPHRVFSYDGGLDWVCTLGGKAASVVNAMCEKNVAAISVKIARELSIETRNTFVIFPVNSRVICHSAVENITFSVQKGSFLLAQKQRSPIHCCVTDELSLESAYFIAIQINPLPYIKRVEHD